MAEETIRVARIGELATRGPERGQAYLIVIGAQSEAGVGRMLKLDQPDTVIGRQQDVELLVDDESISRRHARVSRGADGRFEVVDLDSTNGTYLNGHPVQRAALSDGDKIQIGSNTVLRFSMQDRLDEAYQRSLYDSATRDGLTRVFNKKYFLDTLRKDFAHAMRHRLPLSLLMLDVDHFKRINDQHGHPAGDHVLQGLAACIQGSIRQEDLFARCGGEEFALLLRDASPTEARVCAERCRRAVEEAEFVYGEARLTVTVSLGLASLGEPNIAQPEDLIAAADRSLYEAKAAGRNRTGGLRAMR